MNEDKNAPQNMAGQNDVNCTTFPANNYNGPVVVSNAIPEKSGKYAVGSLACGIISILCCWSTLLGIGLSIAGLVLGIISLTKKCPLKGVAIAGIVASALGILLSFAILILFIMAIPYM